MKWMPIILMCCLSMQVRSQSLLAARELQVTTNKTTNLIFPAAIAHIDRGSAGISVQPSAENILRVKADSVFADTTNLTVITVDGRFYSFLVSYHPSPKVVNVDLGVAANVLQDTALAAIAVKVRSRKNMLHGISFRSGGVNLSLCGLFTNGQVIACKLLVENASPFVFELGRVRCYRTGAPAARRGSKQDVPVALILIDPLQTLLKPRQTQVICLLFPRLVISPGQPLRIELEEQHGARQLVLLVQGKFLFTASNID